MKTTSIIPFLLFFLISGFSQNENSTDNSSPALHVIAKGTGQTTGHIATLSVTNLGNLDKDPTFLIEQQVFLIPSRSNYQGYISHIPPGTTVSPGTMVPVKVYGVCIDVDLPPIPLDVAPPPIGEWIPVATTPLLPMPDEPQLDGNPPMIPEPMNPPGGNTRPGDVIPVTVIPMTPLPEFTVTDIPGITSSSGFTPGDPNILTTPSFPTQDEGHVLTYPGTNIPVEGTIDPDTNPTDFAPLLVDYVMEIVSTTNETQEDGGYNTPFSGDPAKEHSAIVQQTTWIVTSLLTGTDYDEDDFAENVYEQFTSTTGIDIIALPTEDKEKVDSGIDAFWSTFTATGVEAKVMRVNDEKSTSSKPEVVVEEKSDRCTLKVEIIETENDLDKDIANTGTKEANEEMMDAFEASILKAAGKATDKKSIDSIDVSFTTPDLPASVWSLYFPSIVMGRANGAAFSVDLENPQNSAMTTEPISSSAEGLQSAIFIHDASETCESILIGVNVAKVVATSGMKHQLTNVEALAVVNFLGELAIDYVITRGSGKAKKLSRYLKNKIKDKVKDEAKKIIKEEIKKLNEKLKRKSGKDADKVFDDFVEDLSNGINTETVTQANEEGDKKEVDNGYSDDVFAEWLAEMLVEQEDFNPVEKMISDLKDKVDSPIDWAPIKTNTYAYIEGKLAISVNDEKTNANSSSGVRYKRKKLEAAEKTVSGGGVYVDFAQVSDISSGFMTLETNGITSSSAGATGEGIIDTGHGTAVAKLESFNAKYVVAICDCLYTGRDFSTYYIGSVSSEDSVMASIWEKMYKQIMDDLYEKNNDLLDDEKAWKEALEKASQRAASIILRQPENSGKKDK